MEYQGQRMFYADDSGFARESEKMKSRWHTHKGVEIFIADFSHRGGNANEIAAECEAIKQELNGKPQHSVLSVSYVEGTLANEDIVKHLIDLVKITNQYIKRRAVVGVSGYRRYLLYAFSKAVGELKFSVFDSLDEALDWLANTEEI